jgi:hypothetical protein
VLATCERSPCRSLSHAPRHPLAAIERMKKRLDRRSKNFCVAVSLGETAIAPFVGLYVALSGRKASLVTKGFAASVLRLPAFRWLTDFRVAGPWPASPYTTA